MTAARTSGAAPHALVALLPLSAVQWSPPAGLRTAVRIVTAT